MRGFWKRIISLVYDKIGARYDAKRVSDMYCKARSLSPQGELVFAIFKKANINKSRRSWAVSDRLKCEESEKKAPELYLEN